MVGCGAHCVQVASVMHAVASGGGCSSWGVFVWRDGVMGSIIQRDAVAWMFQCACKQRLVLQHQVGNAVT
eukprot:1160141-Pelagomonas_calceolata.AAC.2